MNEFGKISDRAVTIQASPLRKLASIAETRKKLGIKVYHLNIGQPDLPTAPDVFSTLATIKLKTLAYAPSNGLPETLQAWSHYFKNSEIDLSPSEMIVTSGGSEALIFAMTAICDPGDEIIVFEPFYTNYNAFASLSQVKLVPVKLSIENGFHLPPIETIKSKINGRTRGILICNPSNPTGTNYYAEEIKALVNLAVERKIFLLSDEVYREFTYESKHYSIMNEPELGDLGILVDSTSKRFNVCGARIGVIASRNKQVIHASLKFGMARLAVATLEQHAVIPLLENPQKYISPIVKEFRHRRDVVHQILTEFPAITMYKPEGAFYIVIGLPVADSDEFCRWMIEEFEDGNETILMAPANGFYATPGMGANEVRLAFMLQESDLKRSLSLLSLALSQYKHTLKKSH